MFRTTHPPLSDARFGLLLTASTPLLLRIGDLAQALVLGLSAALSLCASGFLVGLCYRWVPVAMRFALLYVIAAAAGCAVYLVIASVAWETAQTLRPALPFLIFNALAFTCLEQDCLGHSLAQALSRTTRLALTLFMLYSLYGLLLDAVCSGPLSPPAILFLLAGCVALHRWLSLVISRGGTRPQAKTP